MWTCHFTKSECITAGKSPPYTSVLTELFNALRVKTVGIIVSLWRLLIASLGSEKAAFPAPSVRDLEKDWIRAPTETNNGSYERRGEGRPNANIHFVRLGEPALTITNFHSKWVCVLLRSPQKRTDFSVLTLCTRKLGEVFPLLWLFNTIQNKWGTFLVSPGGEEAVSGDRARQWNVPSAPAEGRNTEVGKPQTSATCIKNASLNSFLLCHSVV